MIDTNKARELAQKLMVRADCARLAHTPETDIDEAAALLLALADAHDRMAKDAARYRWLADKVLACDYGDNSRENFAIGWIIRHCKGPSVIYGPSIDAAIDAAMGADNG